MEGALPGAVGDDRRVSRSRIPYPDRWLVLASLAVTAAIAVWLHSLRVEVATAESVRIFLSLLLFQDYPAALAMLALVPLGLVPRLRDIGLGLARCSGRHPGWLFAATVCALSIGTHVIYHDHPLAMDEYAAVFQSQVFAAGQVHGQFPPELIDWLVPPGFQGHFLGVSHRTGHVASMYWPGFSLLLAPFAWLGIPWLANPILGGLAVVLVHRLTMRLTDNGDAAGLAALLTIASPAVSVNAISYYSMTAHLVCNLLFVLLLLRATFSHAVAAGLVGSLALVLHNPLPHMLVAMPWLLWTCGQRNRWWLVAGLVMGYAPLCIVLGLGWWQYLAQLTAVGVDPGAAAGSSGGLQAWSARLGTVNVFRIPGLDTLEDRLMALAKMWVWAVPGMMLVSLLGALKSRADTRVRLLAWSAACTLIGFLFVPVDQGHGWGFRYFHAAWFTLPVLATLAIWPVGGRVPDPAEGGRGLAGTLAAWALLSLLVMTGVRAMQVEQFIAGQLAQLPTPDRDTTELVIVKAGRGYYAADLVQNDPFLRGRPMIVWAQDDADAKMLMALHFPGLRPLAETNVASAWGQPDR
jgi:energy-converting hydrogenase Eha subunit B